VGADGLSEEDATIGENVVGLEDGKQVCEHGSVMCREARSGANEEFGFVWIQSDPEWFSKCVKAGNEPSNVL
jgi:hypothetical protein